MNWPQVEGYLYGNRVAIETVGALLATAAIKTMPVPGSRFKFYDWFYDFTHQFLNITNTRLTTAPVITPPASVEEPQPKK